MMDTGGAILPRTFSTATDQRTQNLETERHMSEPQDRQAAQSDEEEQDGPSSLTGQVESMVEPEVDVEVDLRKAIVGGALATSVVLAGTFAAGRISGAEGRILLQAMLPSVRFLCSATVTASSTILALMLTLLGLSYETTSQIKPAHYKRIKQIALVDAIAFVTAALLLLLIIVPLEETEAVPSGWYSTMYYIAIVMSSVLGGLIISVILMLYDAVTDIIDVVGIGTEENPIVSAEQESDES